MAESSQTSSHDVIVQTRGIELPGILSLPRQAHALVAFAHGSGSSRFSSRNKFVADVLHEAGLGTLLFDLLTADEHETDQITAQLRFDIPLLAERLAGAVQWLQSRPPTSSLPIGLFGASTGAAAALIAAAMMPQAVMAVVSRGGRPDLAGEALKQVHAPTLLIVGQRDQPVIEMNRQAADEMRCEHRIEIVPDASHLFEEPGTLDAAARLAQGWFLQHLVHAHKRAS